MVTKADKQKAAKVPVWQGVIAYFSNALHAVGAISKFGAAKHNEGKMPTTWRAYECNVYADALARHIFEEGKGDLYDSESGMLHAGHEAWNALARLEKLLEVHPLQKPLKVIENLRVADPASLPVVPRVPSPRLGIEERRLSTQRRRRFIYSEFARRDTKPGRRAND
jgi:Domain of unknown function (DUF5664)